MNPSSNSILVRAACALALGCAGIAAPNLAPAQISVSITLAPPPLPVYEQPVLVQEGSLWAPGYWEWRGGAHVWIPGRWMGERHGYHWVPDRWDQVGGHWHHFPGHWER